MPHAIRVHEVGGPEVLKWEEVEVGEPGAGQVRLRQEAAGINFIDVYHRTGLYPQLLPFTPGVEGAGVVDAIGPDVTEVKVGGRVARVSEERVEGSVVRHALHRSRIGPGCGNILPLR